MKVLLIAATFLLSVLNYAHAHATSDENFYRNMVMKIRPKVKFKVPMPSNGDLQFSYELQFGKPLWEKTIISDFSLDPDKKKFYRHFWEKIFTLDGSYIEVGGEKVPLTCVFISGQDNRFAKDSPLFPDYVMKIYVVANDFTCTGPINPGWPSNGGKKETWDTYIYYEIKDPTIMLPVEAHVRYRWVEFPAVVVDAGP